jgi:hypothetical protein
VAGFKQDNPGCLCCEGAPPPDCGTYCLTVFGCCGDKAAGAAVTVVRGAFTATCTTNADGTCCVVYPAAGTYAVTAALAPFADASLSVTLPCDNRTHFGTVALWAIPTTLHLTDCRTSTTLTRTSTGTWVGCYSFADAGAWNSTFNGGCTPASLGGGASGGTVFVRYTLQCLGSGNWRLAKEVTSCARVDYGYATCRRLAVDGGLDWCRVVSWPNTGRFDCGSCVDDASDGGDCVALSLSFDLSACQVDPCSPVTVTV